MEKGLNGESSFDQHKQDVIHSVGVGSEAGEPVCIVDGAKAGTIPVGFECSVERCTAVCEGPNQSVAGCVEFQKSLNEFMIRKAIDR